MLCEYKKKHYVPDSNAKRQYKKYYLRWVDIVTRLCLEDDNLTTCGGGRFVSVPPVHYQPTVTHKAKHSRAGASGEDTVRLGRQLSSVIQCGYDSAS